MSLTSFEITPFPRLLAEILPERRSGVLSIVDGGVRRDLYWAQGELVLVGSSLPAESLPAFLLSRRAVDEDTAARLRSDDPLETVPLFHDAGIVDIPLKESLLREWIFAVTRPLFSSETATAVFHDEPAIDPDRRVFLHSMAGWVLGGVRSIESGLQLRRSLGELKRWIAPVPETTGNLSMLPFSESERKIALTLNQAMPVEVFLKRQSADSATAARVLIVLTALGFVTDAEHSGEDEASDVSETERDMAVLAAIDATDTRSLQTLALSKRIQKLDFYQFLEVARAATRNQITGRVEELRRTFQVSQFPPALADAVNSIRKRIDLALATLTDPVRRQEYDRLLAGKEQDDSHMSMDQRVTRRSIAEQNFTRARELATENDYYGAIVLLRETVRFAPEHAEAWYLLGECQSHNPRWLRDATESYHRALSLNPNLIDALISLGDLYRSQGLISRAQSSYEDVLQIRPENAEAAARLKALKKR